MRRLPPSGGQSVWSGRPRRRYRRGPAGPLLGLWSRQQVSHNQADRNSQRSPASWHIRTWYRQATVATNGQCRKQPSQRNKRGPRRGPTVCAALIWASGMIVVLLIWFFLARASDGPVDWPAAIAVALICPTLGSVGLAWGYVSELNSSARTTLSRSAYLRRSGRLRGVADQRAEGRAAGYSRDRDAILRAGLAASELVSPRSHR